MGLGLTITQADYFGRRVGMAIGCLITVIATFIQVSLSLHSIAELPSFRLKVERLGAISKEFIMTAPKLSALIQMLLRLQY